MTNPKDAAFSEDTFARIGSLGLTKREWFAGMAMNGVAVWDAEVNEPIHAGKIEKLARACVGYADALIAELNKELK